MTFGFNIIGFATANLGLGVALRNTAAVLMKNSLPFCVLDIDPGGNRTGHDFSLQSWTHKAHEPLPYGINLFFINPPTIESIFHDLPNLVPLQNHLNICIPFWELAHLPSTWKSTLDKMDLVLAPSHFIEKALQHAQLKAPIYYAKQGLGERQSPNSDRGKWNFKSGRIVFLFSFDISSGIQKKNPLAILELFKVLFPNGEADLILKVNNRNLSSEAAQVVDKLKNVASHIPGAQIWDQVLSFAEVQSLYASIDIFISLHRGEGLGLSMMECMALGKPVIATGWSGNMDFMNEENSCLVPFQLVPLDTGTQYHAASGGVEQVWAEPNLIEAAKWMRKLYESPELRSRIGARAQKDIQNLQAEVEKAEVFLEIRNHYQKSYF